MKTTVTLITSMMFGVWLLAAAETAYAANPIGKVIGFSIQRNADTAGRSILFFAIENQQQAACTTGIAYANFAVELDSSAGRAQLASLLAAHLSGRVLGVWGAGTCNTDHRAEDVLSVDQYQ